MTRLDKVFFDPDSLEALKEAISVFIMSEHCPGEFIDGWPEAGTCHYYPDCTKCWSKEVPE